MSTVSSVVLLLTLIWYLYDAPPTEYTYSILFGTFLQNTRPALLKQFCFLKKLSSNSNYEYCRKIPFSGRKCNIIARKTNNGDYSLKGWESCTDVTLHALPHGKSKKNILKMKLNWSQKRFTMM